MAMHFFPWRKQYSQSRFSTGAGNMLACRAADSGHSHGTAPSDHEQHGSGACFQCGSGAIAEAVAETIENGTYGYNDLISLEKG